MALPRTVKLKRKTYGDFKRGRVWYPLIGVEFRVGTILRLAECLDDDTTLSGQYTDVIVVKVGKTGVHVSTDLPTEPPPTTEETIDDLLSKIARQRRSH